MERLKKGDTIECRDKDDMVAADEILIQKCYQTDYFYEKDGKKGLWIVILGREDEQ